MTDLQKQLEAAGVSDELRREVAGLEEAAVRDPLTGLCNRRFFDEALTKARAAAERYQHDLALVLFDLDDLKTINDSNGHAAGDAALKTFAKTLADSAREADIVCRIGGDEFAVILPETDEPGARTFADRVKKTANEREFTPPKALGWTRTESPPAACPPKPWRRLEGCPELVEGRGGFKISASFGISALPGDLFAVADAELLQAKAVNN